MDYATLSREELLAELVRLRNNQTAHLRATVTTTTSWTIGLGLFLLVAPASVYMGEYDSLKRGFWCFYLLVFVCAAYQVLLLRRSSLALLAQGTNPTPVDAPTTVEEAQSQLNEAIADENYEAAAALHQLIKNFGKRPQPRSVSPRK